MAKEGQPQMHEFWLKKYPDSPDNDPTETTGIYRIALGELIHAKDRLTYPPREGSPSEDHWNQSGSIGFLDIAVREESVPKESATPYPNPSRISSLEHQYTDFERRRALVSLVVGIEPPFRRRGYATLLKQRGEEIAQEWGMDTIVISMIENPITRALNTKLGYTLYEGGRYAVKRLKTNIPEARALSAWDQLSDQSRTNQLKEVGKGRINITPVEDFGFVGFFTELFDGNEVGGRQRNRVIDAFQAAGKAADTNRVRELMDTSFYLVHLDELFKIHLQPKPEHMLEVVRMLTDLFENDTNARTLSHSFKASYKESAKKAEDAPEIVVYPANLGWANAKELLHRLTDYFKGNDSLGSGIT